MNNKIIRLRQICLATLDIRKDEKSLSNIFGLNPCHQEALDHFGLENSLFAINGTFIELVAPTRDNTAVHRFLSRTDGVGGYMAIFDCNEVADRKNAALRLGISPIFERSDDTADLLQLNPKDTGITMLEFDHHKGGKDMLGNYAWAGENWQREINTDTTKSLTSLSMACTDPNAKANQWSDLFETPITTNSKGGQSLILDYGTIHFEENNSDHKDHFKSLSLTVDDPTAMLAKARSHGYPTKAHSFIACGISFELEVA
ncbi:MAG: hypothetical protein V7750_01130 [Sneathiella sp.]